jgi:hypothetical protein
MQSIDGRNPTHALLLAARHRQVTLQTTEAKAKRMEHQMHVEHGMHVSRSRLFQGPPSTHKGRCPRAAAPLDHRKEGDMKNNKNINN